MIAGVSVYFFVLTAVSWEAAAKLGPGVPFLVTMPSDRRFQMCW